MFQQTCGILHCIPILLARVRRQARVQSLSKLLRLPVVDCGSKGRRLWKLPSGSLRSYLTWKTRQCYRNRASRGVAACFSPMSDGFPSVYDWSPDFEAAMSHNSSRWGIFGGLWGGYVFQGRKGELFFLLSLMNWIFSHFVLKALMKQEDFEDAMFRDLGMEGMESKQQWLLGRHHLRGALHAFSSFINVLQSQALSCRRDTRFAAVERELWSLPVSSSARTEFLLSMSVYFGHIGY